MQLIPVRSRSMFPRARVIRLPQRTVTQRDRVTGLSWFPPHAGVAHVTAAAQFPSRTAAAFSV
jgi:hypothetical protein